MVNQDTLEGATGIQKQQAAISDEIERNRTQRTWITILGPGDNKYGIHGTWQPDSIGKEMSKGCVRMLNEEIEWLYNLLVSGSSKIVVKP